MRLLRSSVRMRRSPVSKRELNCWKQRSNMLSDSVWTLFSHGRLCGLRKTYGFSMELNESQKKAVSHFEGPMMVLAGPGSGKTRVITHRVRFLIEQKGIDPSNILVITFTRRLPWRCASVISRWHRHTVHRYLSVLHSFFSLF